MTIDEAICFLKLGGELKITTQAFIDDRNITRNTPIEVLYTELTEHEYMILSYHSDGIVYSNEQFGLLLISKDGNKIMSWSWNKRAFISSWPMLSKGLVS